MSADRRAPRALPAQARKRPEATRTLHQPHKVGDAMASTGGSCTRNGGLALACTAFIPTAGNWLARAYC